MDKNYARFSTQLVQRILHVFQRLEQFHQCWLIQVQDHIGPFATIFFQIQLQYRMRCERLFIFVRSDLNVNQPADVFQL